MNFHFLKTLDFEITNETDLSKIMRSSFLKDSSSIMVEAGPKLVNAFLKNGLCDRLVIYKSQVEIGNDGVNWFENDNVLDKYGFKIKSNYTIGPDIKMVLEMDKNNISELLGDLKKGKITILDDEDRENEGDLVCAAEAVTPEIINFMAKYGRGLICLTLDSENARSFN